MGKKEGSRDEGRKISTGFKEELRCELILTNEELVFRWEKKQEEMSNPSRKKSLGKIWNCESIQ